MTRDHDFYHRNEIPRSGQIEGEKLKQIDTLLNCMFLEVFCALKGKYDSSQ
jgi:hypothetical protein